MRKKEELSVKLGNKKRITLKKSDAETIFKIAAVYEIAQYVKRYVSQMFKDAYTSKKRIVSNMQAKNVAEMALMLIISGEYTDIDYAIDDVYRALGCPSTYNKETMPEPTYTVMVGDELVFLSYEDMKAVEDTILTVKLREVLKRTSPEITQGNKAYNICRQAITLLREGLFTDIEYALEEVVERIDTYDPKTHPLLAQFDSVMIIHDDNYARRVGLTVA